MTLYENPKRDRIVFHFNKAHNVDQTIPQWVIKQKGESFYVNEMVSDVGFKTKNTPDSDHTKGSLMFKGKLKIVQEESSIVAYIS